MLQRHNNATLKPTRMSDNVMFFYRTGLSDLPGLESRAPLLRLHRPAAPTPRTTASRNRTGLDIPTSTNSFLFCRFFSPFVFLTSGNEREELERSTRSRPPHARTASITHTRLTRQRNSSTLHQTIREITSSHS